MSTRKIPVSKILAWAMLPLAVILAGLAILPIGFAHLDPTAYARRAFGVEVGMTTNQARAALLSDERFRFTGVQDCTGKAQVDDRGCADATRIDHYTVHGLFADGWVDLGIRDDHVVYIFADKGKPA